MSNFIKNLLAIPNVIFPMRVLAKDRNFPKTSVNPERKVLAIHECDYTGKLDNECDLYEIYVPYDMINGMWRAIYYSKEYKSSALNDSIRFCTEESIYPINEHLVNYLLEKQLTTIKVKRSSGNIEDGWNILVKSSTRFDKTSNEILLNVTSGELQKSITLDEFVILNDLDLDEVKEILVNALNQFYQIST
jgi:hypothetical protein